MTTLFGFMITRISSFLFLLTIVLLPTVAFGNGDFVKLVGIPNISPSSLSTEDYVQALYKLAIGVGAMLAVLKLIGAGAKYITSDIITSKESAKKDIKNSILGLLVILSAVLVLQTINPALKNLSFLANAPRADVTIENDREKYAIENICNRPAGCRTEICSSNKSLLECRNDCIAKKGYFKSDGKDSSCTRENTTIIEIEETIIEKKIEEEINNGEYKSVVKKYDFGDTPIIDRPNLIETVWPDDCELDSNGNENGNEFREILLPENGIAQYLCVTF